MRKLSTAVVLTVLLGLVLFSIALAAPTLTVVQTQVTILSDGKLNVRYQLSFLENEARNSITTLGPFDAGHQLQDAYIDGPAGRSKISLSSQGGDKYGASLGLTTSRRADVHRDGQLRRGSSAACDPSGQRGPAGGGLVAARVGLAIGEEIVTFITPIELPAGVTKPEQVTQDIVAAAGLLEDSAVKSGL